MSARNDEWLRSIADPADDGSSPGVTYDEDGISDSDWEAFGKEMGEPAYQVTGGDLTPDQDMTPEEYARRSGEYNDWLESSSGGPAAPGESPFRVP